MLLREQEQHLEAGPPEYRGECFVTAAFCERRERQARAAWVGHDDGAVGQFGDKGRAGPVEGRQQDQAAAAQRDIPLVGRGELDCSGAGSPASSNHGKCPGS